MSKLVIMSLCLKSSFCLNTSSCLSIIILYSFVKYIPNFIILTKRPIQFNKFIVPLWPHS